MKIIIPDEKSKDNLDKIKIKTFHRGVNSRKDRKEIKEVNYHIGKNTDFKKIFQGEDFFMNNFLTENNYYENENKNWNKYYNASFVVPVQYNPKVTTNERREILGFLCIDSFNASNANLFDEKNHKDIVLNSADVIAILLKVHYYISREVSDV